MSENYKLGEGKYWDNRNEGEKNCFFSSVFIKKDGKVILLLLLFFYSLNEGTFVILLLKVIFFLIYIFFSFLYFFPPIILQKINLLYFFRPRPFYINQMHPSAVPICLFQFFFFFFSCTFNDVKTKYLVCFFHHSY